MKNVRTIDLTCKDISISKRNDKLGDIPSFSLPLYVTCPGATQWCLKHCYVGNYWNHRPNVRKAYQRNLDLGLDTLESSIDNWLKKHAPIQFRIHVSGDFYSIPYIQMWARIARLFPTTKFIHIHVVGELQNCARHY